MPIATLRFYTTGGRVGHRTCRIGKDVCARQGTPWGVSLSLFLIWLSACGAQGTETATKAASSVGEAATEVAGETAIAGSVSAMNKGDIYLVDLTGGSATVDFSSTSADAEYQLVVQSTSTSAGSATVSVGNLSSAKALSHLKATVGSHPLAAQEYLDSMLREMEQSMTGTPIHAAGSQSKGLGKSVSVGASETFRVLSSLSTVSSYKTVTATVRCVETVNSEVGIALYVDDAASNALTSDQVTTLCKQYAAALKTEYSIVGNPSDINSDGTIVVLATKVVNEIGGSLGGIVTGFFFGGDLLARTTSNPASNEREIVYTLLPDPTGQYGTKIPIDFAMGNLLPAVVPHEVQHMLSYYNHVIKNSGAAEASWLNEALSHLVEDVVGQGQENPSRIELFLATMNDTALIPSGSPGLEERGASYLFLRFLYEQASSGNTFLSALVNATETGTTNVETAFGNQFSTFDEWKEFLLRWGVALAVTNQGVTSDSRYVYDARTFQSDTSHWQGVCLVCDTEDGRETTLAGPTLIDLNATGSLSVYAGANAIYDLSSPPSTLTIETTSANLQGVLIRIK